MLDVGLGEFVKMFEAHYGPRWAKALSGLLAAAITILCLYVIYEYLIHPIVEFVSTIPASNSIVHTDWFGRAVSGAVSGVVFGLIYYGFIRIQRRVANQELQDSRFEFRVARDTFKQSRETLRLTIEAMEKMARLREVDPDVVDGEFRKLAIHLEAMNRTMPKPVKRAALWKRLIWG